MTPCAVLQALAALASAPGWQTTAPTPAEISAHGRAFPYGPHDGTDDDFCAGLWALRDAGGVSLVDLCMQAFPEGADAVARLVGADAFAVEEVLAATVTGGRAAAWLRLTADGRPVAR